MTSGSVLGTFSREQWQRVAERHSLGTSVQAKLLGGSHGNNWALTTERGRWVVRLAIPPLEPMQLHREQFFARMLHERCAIASPWPYLVDESGDDLGYPYALMPRLPGEVLNPWADVQWSQVGIAFSHAVAELHRVEFPSIGTWDADTDDIAPIEISAADWFLSRTRQLIEAASLDDTSAAFVEAVAGEGAAAIGAFTPTYVHGDLGIANLLAEGGPDGYRFTGVVDLGGGYAGDPDEDLAIPLWWPLYFGNATLSRNLLDGYRAEHPARPGERERLRAYIAASLLTNWETGHRLGHDWYGGVASFHGWALPLLDRADEIIGR